MTITSKLTVHSNRISKVDISSVVDVEGDNPGIFNINEVDTNSVEFELVTPFPSQTVDVPQAIFENETELKKNTLEYIEELIQMYREMYGSISSSINKFDVRKKLAEDE